MLRKFSLALLLLGISALISAPVTAHAQTKPVLTTLHTFDGTDGNEPAMAPVLGKDGNLYGTTGSGGLGFGTLYKLDPATNRFTTLFAFNGYNGGTLYESLICGSDGNLYGVAGTGGTGFTPSNPYSGAGLVFRITPDGTLTTIHKFSPLAQDGTNEGGIEPRVPLTQGPDGTLYGVTGAGGRAGAGTIFQITPGGAFSVVHDFHNKDGYQALGQLSFGPDGALYGSMSEGGTYNYGTIFRARPGIDFHVLRSTLSGDGYFIETPLLTGPDNALYGAAHFGSTLFKITPSGQYTTLYRFHDSYGGLGSSPSSLVAGPDGLFYGTNDNDGEGLGSIYRFSPDGSVTSLYQFHAAPDGTFPHGNSPGGVIYGGPGVLYGTTEFGGTLGEMEGGGTIFKLTLP